MSDAEAVTLVTADIERIGTSIDMIHEIYASFLEVGLALWLLYRLLGVAVSAPAAYIVGMVTPLRMSCHFHQPVL